MSKSLLNTIYLRPERERDWNDLLMMVVKDNETGKKSIEYKYNPTMKWYITKPEYRFDKKLFSIPYNMVEERISPYKDLELEMFKELGQDAVDSYYEARSKGDWNNIRAIHLNPIFHQTDMNIEDHYISNFIDKYGSDIPKFNKAYFDIEVDALDEARVDPDFDGGFPEEDEAPAPINAVTFFYSDTMEAKTYLLRNPNNPLVEDFENSDMDKFTTKIDNYFKEHFGTAPGTFKYDIKFYDEEEDLIIDSINDNHDRQPDFNLAWNMRFDILTYINRSKRLGIDPEELFSHPDFPESYMYYRKDEMSKSFQDMSDYFQVSSYSVWMDMLLNYAQLRQGQTELSYSLNSIAEKELGTGKYEMDEGVDIVNFAYKDYENFVFYNIVDVMLLYYMEEKLNEVDQLVNVSVLTKTRLNKAMTKTICLKNMAADLFLKNEQSILSNNRNKGLPRVPFKAGFVADSTKNTGGVSLNGVESRYIFEYVIDFDFSSLYPSIIQLLNIDVTTQIGRIEFTEDMGIDPDSKENIDGSYLVKALISKDYPRIAQKYIDLRSSMDISRDITSGKYDHILNS